MKEHILQIIKQVEIEYGVKVLFACEAGSRAWGIASKDSDYDVRFIYVHRKNWYLSIDQKRDVIEIPNRDPVSIPVNEKLDLSGWELTKALRLFRKSNPSLLEWLHSSMVYAEYFSAVERMRQLEKKVFSPDTCLHHYFNMAKGNFRDCVKSSAVNVKKYINVIRPLLAAKWIEQHHNFPEVELQSLTEQLLADGNIKDTIKTLIELKKNYRKVELDLEILHSFFQQELSHIESSEKKSNKNMYDSTEELNKLFRDTLAEVWERSME